MELKIFTDANATDIFLDAGMGKENWLKDFQQAAGLIFANNLKMRKNYNSNKFFKLLNQ